MIAKRLLLRAGDEFTLAGPALLTVNYGELDCLGKKVQAHEDLLIRQGKLLPLVTLKDASVEVRLQFESDLRLIPPSQLIGTKIWDDVVKKVIKHVSECCNCLIIVLGPVNSGKSTLITYAANKLLYSTRVLVADTDIGQNDLGPPGSLAAGLANEQITDLREIQPSNFDFIGFISAGFNIQYVTERIIRFVRKMQTLYKEKCAILVNTDGFIGAKGLESKIQLVRELNPHLVIVTDPGLKWLLGHHSAGFIEARKPEGILKTRGDRISKRLLQYLKFLKGSRQRCLDLKDLKLCMLNKSCKLISSVPETRDTLVHRLRRANVVIKRDIAYVPFNVLTDMFVALVHEDEVRGFGIIAGRKEEETLVVKTPVQEPIDGIYLSLIRLPNLAKEDFIRVIVNH